MNKHILLIALMLYISTHSFSQITFRVCDVNEKYSRIMTSDYETALNKRISFQYDNAPDRRHNGNYVDGQEKRIGNDIEAYGINNAGNEMYSCHYHPFIETLHLSFAEHRPITISPDMIWLLIVQGFANHVDVNSDSLRGQFVHHEGKVKITIRRDTFRKGVQNPWENTFPEFCDSISKYVGNDLNDLIVSKFTTTLFAETAAFQVSLMDAMDNYFKYEVLTICGIPEITLTGKPEDWKLILSKVEQFRQYELDWWVDELTPVLEQFVDASKGEVDAEFWQSIYKRENQSGGPHVTGWILKFFPYVFDYQNQLVRNTKMNGSWGLTIPSFTSGYSKVDFIWDYRITGDKFDMEFIAGFVGILQDEKGNLQTEINWAVREKMKQ